MADLVDSATRSRMMSGIRRRDTRIELLVRRALFARGFRYRVDVRGMPGRPDVVLAKHRAVVMVHGCFWHMHGCRLSSVPATRREFWLAKLEGNRSRDVEANRRLAEAGWRVATIWECAIRGRGATAVDELADVLADWLRNGELRQVEFACP